MGVVAGANQGKVTLITSTYATESVENVCRAATQPVWFQLYARPDREFNQSLIQRAEAAGCKAIVVTVDTPAIGIRNRESETIFGFLQTLTCLTSTSVLRFTGAHHIMLSAYCPIQSLPGKK